MAWCTQNNTICKNLNLEFPRSSPEFPGVFLNLPRNSGGEHALTKCSKTHISRSFRVVKTVFLENGVFVPYRKQVVVTKNGENDGFDEKWRKRRFTFYPQKQGVALLRARKPTKMTKMAGVQVKLSAGKNPSKNQHTVPDHVLAYPLRRNFPSTKT